jgi:hypothetical protein
MRSYCSSLLAFRSRCLRSLFLGRRSDPGLNRGRRAYLGLLGELQPGHYEGYVRFMVYLFEEKCTSCLVVMLLICYAFGVGDGD